MAIGEFDHGGLPLGTRHAPHNWEYADAAARTAATGFVPGDVTKWAKQLDDGTFWELTDDSPVTWSAVGGSSGGGAVSSVNGQTGVVALTADDIPDGVTHALTTIAEIAKLAGIEAGADVTDPTNVAAAGAVMETDTDASGFGFVVDEDGMSSDSATKVPTQQSVKAFVEAQFAGAGYTDEQARDAIGTAIVAGSGLDVTVDDAGNIITIDREAITAKIGPSATFDGGGAALTTSVASPIIRVPYATTLTGDSISADAAGSAVVDVQRATAAAPNTFTSIAGTAKPTLSSAQSATDTALTGWGDTTLDEGDFLRFVLSSVSGGIEWLGVFLHGTRAL